MGLDLQVGLDVDLFENNKQAHPFEAGSDMALPFLFISFHNHHPPD